MDTASDALGSSWFKTLDLEYHFLNPDAIWPPVIPNALSRTRGSRLAGLPKKNPQLRIHQLPPQFSIQQWNYCNYIRNTWTYSNAVRKYYFKNHICEKGTTASSPFTQSKQLLHFALQASTQEGMFWSLFGTFNSTRANGFSVFTKKMLAHLCWLFSPLLPEYVTTM